MCGIAGFFDPAALVDPARYESIAGAMADRLAHRGPDDRGAWCDGAAGIALGFRRLSILDLSPAGHQPMLSADGRYVLLFNGEIYNHRELRRALEPALWRGHSDSEALIEGIARWGVAETLARANGMFAIAVWDRRERKLVLARDRFGEKPLYYGTIGGVLLFASELGALPPHPIWRGDLDRAAIAAYLRFGFVPAPFSAFAGMRKLPPGHSIEFSAASRQAEPRAYWSLADAAAAAMASPFRGSFDDAARQFQSLLDDAVSSRMEADVPLGAFLSGGIDSSGVVASMEAARQGAARSFCIGFPDEAYDEAPHAEAVARHLGAAHTTLRVSEQECLDILPRVAATYDEPFADASQIPTIILCHLTRQHVTVALSGDGGDELLGGYARYGDAAAAWRRVAASPAAFRALARGASQALAGIEFRPIRRLRRTLERGAYDTPQSLYADYLASAPARDRLGPPAPATSLDAPLDRASSLEQSFMLRDAATYLPDDLLVKVDRASMAFGLEVRAPFLDHRIAAFAWSLPLDFLIEGQGKRLARAALGARVPHDLADRPKRGFEPPLARWLQGALKPWADERLRPARLAAAGFVAPEIVASRWAAHRSGRRNWARALWPVLMLEDWLEMHTGRNRGPR
jgi:asparagine synthase (glutamine-hydrolysing)